MNLEYKERVIILPLYFEFVANPPYCGDGPVGVVFNLFTETFDMYVHGAGVAYILIAPDVVQKLFPGEYLVG